MLYDLAAASLGPSSQNRMGAALPQLYIEGFDAEQIWLQLDMQVELFGVAYFGLIHRLACLNVTQHGAAF